MHNKDILKEFFWLTISFLISFIIIIFLHSKTSTSIYVSDIFIAKTGEHAYSFKDSINPITFSRTLFLFFPILFTQNSIREFLQKFSRHPQNVFLLFVSIISLIVTLITMKLHALLNQVDSHWTFYPSAFIEILPLQSFRHFTLLSYSFLTFNIMIFIVLARQIFKHPK